MADSDSSAQTSDIEAVRDLQPQLICDAQDAPRKQHPKVHGVVSAQCDIPDHCTVGLFGCTASYIGSARFAHGNRKADSHSVVRGMTIKLIGVNGKKIFGADEETTTHDSVITPNVPASFDFSCR